MSSSDGYQGEAFDFVVSSSEAGERVRVFGRAFSGRCERPLQGMSGSVTVNSLDWRGHEPIHVRFELRYHYDDDLAKWSTIEVCSEANVTREN